MQAPGDEEGVKEADQKSSIKKNLKAVMWPEMDSDALPSSYLLKVFAALEKWDVKLSSIVEAVQDETTDKSVLCFGYGCYVTCPPKLSSDLCPIGASSTCLLLCVLPRLKSKAKEMSTALQNISAELEKIQTAGLCCGIHGTAS